MPKRPTPKEIAAQLGVHDRVLLFCLAPGTEWGRAGVTHATAQQMLVRGLVDRDPGPARFKPTPLGAAALRGLTRTKMPRDGAIVFGDLGHPCGLLSGGALGPMRSRRQGATWTTEPPGRVDANNIPTRRCGYSDTPGSYSRERLPYG